ncbi:MAG: magnesium chelatase, partial [Candidatus Omnitrophica bacterium CG12_big_fil_rev_8_21_14_0_65_50_5]
LEESLETTQIHSIAGQTLKTGIIRQRPFRSPHHTTSDVAIVGGGSIPRPGEVSLSHHGILFLDELPEFQRDVLESLRQPLEDHFVTVTRAARSTKFPSKFMLVCTMNPCPCGFLTEPKKECHCSTQQVERYKSRISGPLLDRIDIHLEVPSLPSDDLLSKVRKGEPSSDIRGRVMAARKIQNNRFVLFPTKANSQMSHKDVEIHCPLNQLCHDLMKQAIDQLGLSARSYDKILKISRTIADLEGQADLKPGHILEAIQYRSLDRSWKS